MAARIARVHDDEGPFDPHTHGRGRDDATGWTRSENHDMPAANEGIGG